MARKIQESKIQIPLEQFRTTMTSMKLVENKTIEILGTVQLDLTRIMSQLNFAASALSEAGNHSAAEALWAEVLSLQKEKRFLYKIVDILEGNNES